MPVLRCWIDGVYSLVLLLLGWFILSLDAVLLLLVYFSFLACRDSSLILDSWIILRRVEASIRIVNKKRVFWGRHVILCVDWCSVSCSVVWSPSWHELCLQPFRYLRSSLWIIVFQVWCFLHEIVVFDFDTLDWILILLRQRRWRRNQNLWSLQLDVITQQRSKLMGSLRPLLDMWCLLSLCMMVVVCCFHESIKVLVRRFHRRRSNCFRITWCWVRITILLCCLDVDEYWVVGFFLSSLLLEIAWLGQLLFLAFCGQGLLFNEKSIILNLFIIFLFLTPSMRMRLVGCGISELNRQRLERRHQLLVLGNIKQRARILLILTISNHFSAILLKIRIFVFLLLIVHIGLLQYFLRNQGFRFRTSFFIPFLR